MPNAPASPPPEESIPFRPCLSIAQGRDPAHGDRSGQPDGRPGTGRIHRLWLNGDKQGQHDLFFDGLPGGPDNLSFNGVDTFWVALPILRDPEVEKLSSQPLVRKLLATLPVESLLPVSTHGFVVALDVEGNVKTTLQSNAGGFHNITSANEFDGKLFVGSIAMRSVGMLELE